MKEGWGGRQSFLVVGVLLTGALAGCTAPDGTPPAPPPAAARADETVRCDGDGDSVAEEGTREVREGKVDTSTRTIGDTRVFAVVPDPGHPGAIEVHDGEVFVATFGHPTQQFIDPSLFCFSKAGKLKSNMVIPAMIKPAFMHFSAVVVGPGGYTYVVDMNGRVLKIDRNTGAHEMYAEFPGSMGGMTTMPTDIAFDPAGNAYVTDLQLTLIWKIPPGGGSPTVWFSPGMAGGFAGIRLDPSGQYLYFVAWGEGTVYRLPLAIPAITSLEQVIAYPPLSQPFGLAFGSSGKLYVSVVALNQISIVNPDGQEELRFPSAAQNAALEVPYDAPLGIGFDGDGSLLVTNGNWNDRTSQDPSHWVVFDAWVDDVAAAPPH